MVPAAEAVEVRRFRCPALLWVLFVVRLNMVNVAELRGYITSRKATRSVPTFNEGPLTFGWGVALRGFVGKHTNMRDLINPRLRS